MPARNQIHAGIFCEPEGLSPDGGLIYSTNRKPHQTGEPGGLSPSGGKTPANLLSLEYPRAHRARCGVQGFSPAKCQRGIKSTLAFSASRRACRPTAVLSIQLTGSHTRPASREACRRAAVKPRPTCFPSSTPAPCGRGVGCRALALQKASGKSNPRWPCLRAMRPVAEWRSESAKRQGATPDRRAARPVAERR